MLQGHTGSPFFSYLFDSLTKNSPKRDAKKREGRERNEEERKEKGSERRERGGRGEAEYLRPLGEVKQY